jgi:WD40 repeat protein
MTSRHLSAFAALLALAVTSATQAADEKVTYVDHVEPIFRAKCGNCHNADKKIGGLDLLNYAAMREGGGSGASVEPGDTDASFLWQLVTHESTPTMPPNQPKMPEKTLNTIKAWILGGALETKNSKKVVKDKPKVALSLSFAPNGRPEGPPPMPTRLSLDPVVQTERTTAVSAIATSPWAPVAAVGGQRQILLYNTQTLELIGVLDFPEGIAHVLKFSRSGGLLLAAGGKGSYKGKVIVWDIKTGERVIEVGNETDAVLGADISADQSMIALGGPSKIVRVFSTATGELLYEQKKHTEWVCAVEFSPDGVLLASGDRNGGVFVWEAETGREYLGLRGHSKMITGFSWRKDSNVLASASDDTTVRLWEMENGGQIKSWGAHGGGTQDVTFTQENQIATVGRDRTAKLWNGDGAAVRTFEAFPDLALKVAYCDTTKRVIAGDWTGLIRVWNAADGKRLGEITSNPLKLESRLAQATAALTQAQADQKTKSAAWTAAQAVATKMTTDLNTAKAKQAEHVKLAATYQAAMTTAKATEADARAKADAGAKVVATLQPVVPLLNETVAKATAAAAKAPADKEVVAAVTQLKTVAAARAATLTAATKVVTDEGARLKAAQATIVTTTKQLTDNAAAAAAAKIQADQLTASLAAQQKTVAAAKTTLDQATAAQTTAQSQVTRWKEEITFTQKLVTFETRQSEVDDLAATFAEMDAELKAAQLKVTQTQAALQAAQAGENAVVAAVAAAKQIVDTAAAVKDSQAKLIASRETAAPILTEARDKGAAAAAAVPSDKELAAAAGQLKAAFDRNTKAIADGKTKLAELTAAHVKAAEAMKAEEAKVAPAKAVVVAATKQLADSQAAMKPVAEKHAKAKQDADTAQAALNQLKQELDGLRQQAQVAAKAPTQG